MSSHSKTPNPSLYAFGTVFFWASAFPLTKLSLQYFSAESLGVLRYLTASLCLLLVFFTKRIGLPRLKDVPLFLLSGALGFTFYMLTFNRGTALLTSAASSVLIATAPIMTALFSVVFLKEKIRSCGWLAILLSFLGILVLTLWDGVFSLNIGILWIILAALCISGYNLLQRRFTKTYTPLQATTYSIFAGTLLLLIYLPQAVPQLLAAPPMEWVVLLFLGALPSTLSYVWWAKALSIAKKTSDVTNFMFVTPLLAMLMGFGLIQEVPSLGTLLGGAMIIGGLLLFHKATLPTKPTPTKNEISLPSSK